MKQYRILRRAALLCVMLLIAALPLISCTGDTPDTPDDSSGTVGSSGSPTETAVPEVPPLQIIDKDGVCDYTIIRPEDGETNLISQVIAWRAEFNSVYKTDAGIRSDWSKDNKDNNTVTSGRDVLEILIGDTNRAESRQVAADSGLNCGYVIRAVNGKLVIWGTDTNTTRMAMEYFLDNVKPASDGSLSVPADYSYVWNLTGEGGVAQTLMTQYKVIRGENCSDREKAAAVTLQSGLQDMTGMTIGIGSDYDKAKPDTVTNTENEILIGSTNRSESQALEAKLDYMDYCVSVTENKVLVLGGSPLSTARAAEKFLELVSTGKIASLDGGYEYRYLFKEARPDSLVWSMDSFVPVWAGEFTPAAWMLDFDEKVYACTNPAGRLASDAHRGDVQNYPENSLECILSAVMMGADVIEIDPRLTADNVMVLMHDATLTRTTDYSTKRGKNGLPMSDKLVDWTYEQLLQLNLKLDGKVTEYKIPTAYEAVAACAGRTMIHFDCKDDNIQKNSDVFLLADELNAKPNFFYYYGQKTMTEWLALNREDKAFGQFVKTVADYLAQPGAKLRSRNFELIAKYGDNADAWNRQVSDGYTMIFTNKIYDICRYISKNCSPLDYKK